VMPASGASMMPRINTAAKINKKTNSVFEGWFGLEKYRFNQLEKPVSEKANPGQVDNHCCGQACYRPGAMNERNWSDNGFSNH
jgi:hypothetical protein